MKNWQHKRRPKRKFEANYEEKKILFFLSDLFVSSLYLFLFVFCSNVYSFSFVFLFCQLSQAQLLFVVVLCTAPFSSVILLLYCAVPTVPCCAMLLLICAFLLDVCVLFNWIFIHILLGFANVFLEAFHKS